MARKIDPSKEERALLKQKNLERRNTLYTIPTPKFNINDQDISEAEQPLSQMSDIINRFKNQNNTTKTNQTGFDHLYNEEDLSRLDNDSSSILVSTNQIPNTNNPETSSNNVQADTRSIVTPVTESPVSDFVTTSDKVTSPHENSVKPPVLNKITDFNPHVESITPSVIETRDDSDTGSITETSTDNEISNYSIHKLQKFDLINSIFLFDKDLSNVEKNFLVCLILEMKEISERMSLNQLITKYDFRRATVYQVIPKLSNLGFIKVVSDNNPKGSIIDLSLLFEKYNVPTVLENVTSDSMSLVRKNNNSLSNFTEDSDLNENGTSKKLDITKRIRLKHTILFIFKSMMLLEPYRKLDYYNQKSIKLFSSYLLKNEVSKDSQNNLLGLALYSAEKAKNPERIIYYLHSTLENDGIESLQIAFKDKAKQFLEFSNKFFELDFEEPSLKEIREYSMNLSLDASLNRNHLVVTMTKIRSDIEENISRIDDIIDQLPEFRK